MRWRRRRDQRACIDAAVAAGPPCACGHARADHRGSTVLPGGGRPLTWFDGPCQVDGCPCTPSGYAFPDGSPYVAPDMIGRL